jgi:organic radical activating enzyme
MSDYGSAADQAEKQLRNISKTMCYAKWAQVSMHLTNGQTHSCYHPPTHKIDVLEIQDNPSALHNTRQKKEERKMMLEGKRPAGCSYCWKIEDVGGRSDRIYRSGEYWAQNARKDIIETLDVGNINPRYVEVNFNQACNFKCSYCSPHLSNTWEREIKKDGPYNIIGQDGHPTKHNDIAHLEKIDLMPIKVAQDENPYVTAFWKWWPELYKTLEVFRMTGGEPLMDSNTYKVLDYIYENPNAWLEVSVTSNMCPDKPKLMDMFVEKLQKLEEIQIWQSERFNPGSGNHWYVNMAVKNFAVFVSLDGAGKQAEYIRNGLNYDTLQTNVERILGDTCNTTITFINTFNSLSLTSFKEFLEYILELRHEYSRQNQGVKKIPIYDPYNTHPDFEVHPRQRIWFDVPLLRNPEWQCINTLPEEFEKYLEEAIEFMEHNSNVDDFVGFYDFEIAKVKRNLEWMRERNMPREKLDIARKNFVKFFKQHDARRGTDFLDTFPEFTSFWRKWE